MMTLPQVKMMLKELEIVRNGLTASMTLHPDDKEGVIALRVVNIKIAVVEEILELSMTGIPKQRD